MKIASSTDGTLIAALQHVDVSEKTASRLQPDLVYDAGCLPVLASLAEA